MEATPSFPRSVGRYRVFWKALLTGWCPYRPNVNAFIVMEAVISSATERSLSFTVPGGRSVNATIIPAAICLLVGVPTDQMQTLSLQWRPSSRVQPRDLCRLRCTFQGEGCLKTQNYFPTA